MKRIFRNMLIKNTTCCSKAKYTILLQIISKYALCQWFIISQKIIVLNYPFQKLSELYETDFFFKECSFIIYWSVYTYLRTFTVTSFPTVNTFSGVNT